VVFLPRRGQTSSRSQNCQSAPKLMHINALFTEPLLDTSGHPCPGNSDPEHYLGPTTYLCTDLGGPFPFLGLSFPIQKMLGWVAHSVRFLKVLSCHLPCSEACCDSPVSQESTPSPYSGRQTLVFVPPYLMAEGESVTSRGRQKGTLPGF
jgi:hypothetical protein